MLYHLIVLLMNVVYRLGASVWMAYKLIGGVPSFVVDFAWSYTWIMEINTKILRSIILREDLFAILGTKVESGWFISDERL